MLLAFVGGGATASVTYLAHGDQGDPCSLAEDGRLRLAGCDLRTADLRKADLRGADLRAASLDGKDLSGLDMTGADLRGASMPQAVLRRTVLQGAQLTGADLRGAVLEGTCVRGTDLTLEELAHALTGPGTGSTAAPAPSDTSVLGVDTSACKR